jgi:hypothetical protein
MTWLMTQDTDFSQQGLQKLVPQYDRFLRYGGDAEEI